MTCLEIRHIRDDSLQIFLRLTIFIEMIDILKWKRTRLPVVFDFCWYRSGVWKGYTATVYRPSVPHSYHRLHCAPRWVVGEQHPTREHLRQGLAGPKGLSFPPCLTRFSNKGEIKGTPLMALVRNISEQGAETSLGIQLITRVPWKYTPLFSRDLKIFC